MTTVVIIPGLAVRTYARDAARALRDAGFDAHLLRAPTWRRAPASIERYAALLAADLDRRAVDVDLLVGLSIGTQAAAIVARDSPHVRRLLLISPTVDPSNRGPARLLRAWLCGDERDSSTLGLQLRDWARAGVTRIARGFVSILRTRPLDDVLPELSVATTVVHAADDALGSEHWARRLADRSGARFILLPRARHSWPVDDATGFVELVAELTR